MSVHQTFYEKHRGTDRDRQRHRSEVFGWSQSGHLLGGTCRGHGKQGLQVSQLVGPNVMGTNGPDVKENSLSSHIFFCTAVCCPEPAQRGHQCTLKLHLPAQIPRAQWRQLFLNKLELVMSPSWFSSLGISLLCLRCPDFLGTPQGGVWTRLSPDQQRLVFKSFPQPFCFHQTFRLVSSPVPSEARSHLWPFKISIQTN